MAYGIYSEGVAAAPIENVRLERVRIHKAKAPFWLKFTEGLRLQGVEVNEIDIAAVFDKPETVQPRTEAEIREINTRAGIPLRTQLRDDGWTDAEIETMEDDKRQEAKIAQENMPKPVVTGVNGAVNPQKAASNGMDNGQAN